MTVLIFGGFGYDVNRYLRGPGVTGQASAKRDGDASSGGAGRRERNKRDKRNRIVAAARTLFRTQGYEDTTTLQIAQAAGIASGTLFLYAKSKEDLLVLVFNNEMLELVDQAYAALGEHDGVLEQVLGLFGRFIDYHDRDVAIARALIRELTFLSNPERAEEVEGTVRAILSKLERVIETGKSRGAVGPRADAALLARCLFAIYYQQLQTWLSGYVTREAFEASLTELIGLVLETKK